LRRFCLSPLSRSNLGQSTGSILDFFSIQIVAACPDRSNSSLHGQKGHPSLHRCSAPRSPSPLPPPPLHLGPKSDHAAGISPEFRVRPESLDARELSPTVSRLTDRGRDKAISWSLANGAEFRSHHYRRLIPASAHRHIGSRV
jgi:hypothetical protein